MSKAGNSLKHVELKSHVDVVRPIYVAGKWADKVQLKEHMSYLAKEGFIQTYDWTAVEHPNATNQELAEYAAADVNGVLTADILVVIITDPEYMYKGTNTELGVALGQGKPVAIIDPFEDSVHSRNIFTKHSLVSRYKTIQAFIDANRT